MSTRNEFVRGAAAALTWLGLLAVFGLLLAVVVVPRVAGWVPLTVLTGSMDPTIPPGSQVVVEPVEGDADVAELAIGDIITFMPNPDDPTLVTHRVIGMSQDSWGEASFTTQGDANDVADIEPVAAQQIRGVVQYHVPYAGYVASALSLEQKSAGTTLVAAGLFGIAGWELVSAIRSRRSAAEGEQDPALERLDGVDAAATNRQM